MRTKATALTLVVLSLSGSAPMLAAQSLADVARQEQARRKTIKKPSKVLTNKDLGAGSTPAVASTAPPAAGAPAPDTGDADKKADDPAKGQSFWAGRAKTLQSQLDRDQTFATALQSQINALTTQYTNQGDPLQQAALARDRQKAIAELSRTTKQIADDKKAISDLQEEARRAGVPSGWLR